MKMKEVCALTGLTERTVRFYAEKGLVVPKSHRQNGREYSDYSAEDVDALRTVSTLRRMLFSIEEIAKMSRKPSAIPQIIDEYRERIAAEAEIRAEILALDADALSACRSITELARAVREPAARRRLPEGDVSPDFSRFEPESPEDKEAEYRRFLEKQQRQEKRGFVIVTAIACFNVLASIASLILGSGNIVVLILDIVLSAALMIGQNWARIVFIIGQLLTALFSAVAVSSLLSYESVAPAVIVLIFVVIALHLAAAAVLVWNKAVREYLYRQKNG